MNAAGALIAVLLFSSCATQKAPLAHMNRAPIIRGPARTVILKDPWDLLDEKAFPKIMTQQGFTWSASGTQWEIQMFEPGRAYAEFRVRKPYDFSGDADSLSLTFLMRPLEMAKNCSLALVDRDGSCFWLPRRDTLESYRTAARRGWSAVRIPLSEFCKSFGGASSGAVQPDWSSIRAVRLIRLCGDRQVEKVNIRKLEVQPTGWAMRR